MSNVSVCVRFRPLNHREKKLHGDKVCLQALDAESFVFKDEKEEDLVFCFDRVFYQDSLQADVYDFLAMPIVRDTVDGVNGTIITYGQTGAGKTYSMEGLGILEDNEDKKGLLPRVVYGLFESISSHDKRANFVVRLSMVEIYMEKVRDLFDLSKDNVQIKENKSQEIFLSGATEISIHDPSEALRCLQRGISNRAVGETQMNMASSRSHCVYIFSVQHEYAADCRVKTGKLILVDLAGSEKVEKTGAEGRVLEEAKTINKSLSALGNVINALTTGRVNHIPYRDSKLTRILQDALGGDCRTGLLCCCSPSSSNASESLSTLRFGTRTKLIKPPSRTVMHIQQNLTVTESLSEESTVSECSNPIEQILDGEICSGLSDRIINKLRESLSEENVNLLEDLLVTEGILVDSLTEDLESASDIVAVKTISALEDAILELKEEVEELKRENKILKAELASCLQLDPSFESPANRWYFHPITWLSSVMRPK